MIFIDDSERDIVTAVAGLVDCNPFLPERIELERRALRDAFVPVSAMWSAAGAPEGEAATAIGALDPNAGALRQLVEALATKLRKRLAAGARATPEELADYDGVVLYLLFQRYEDEWYKLLAPKRAVEPVDWYGRFAQDVEEFFSPRRDDLIDAAHLVALGFQARRAFHYIFRHLFGSSWPAILLRARVWEAIFSRNMRRYRKHLYLRMGDVPTLITGASGTGKELVARAFGLSRYVPFDAETRTFVADPTAVYCAMNLSALSSGLIESELFGHRAGAFTGALEDRCGWLEACGAWGAVFLDEIGDVDAGVQIKLLRVMQSREFQRIGETVTRRFGGKVITATHRNLDEEIAAGRFRDDFYQRISGVRITTPTLREQLADAPEDLGRMIRIIAVGAAGAEEAEAVSTEVADWVRDHLGADYAWPGNMRELEHCVQSVLMLGTYVPRQPPADPLQNLAHSLRACTLNAEELVQFYCASVYARSASYQETGLRVGLDPRTVRDKLKAWKRRNGDGAPE